MAVASDDIRIRVVMDCSKADCKAPMSGFRKGVAEADKGVASLGKGLKSVGALAAGAFAVAGVSKFVGAMDEAVDMAAKLDKGVREIGTLVGGLTKGELASMKVELEELSVASGQAIEPLTKARYDIVSAGFSDAADSALLLEKSARLAVGGVTDVATAADLTTTVLNAYQQKASEVGSVHDDLFTIVRNGKTTMDELGSNMGALIATAGPLGVSLDEVGAGMSALTSQGQATAIATTSLSAAIQTLSNPNKELVAALKAVGVETDNLIKTGGGLAGALELVQKASDETGIAVNKLITREEALRAIMPLLSSASEKFAADLDSMANNAGAADAAFRDMAGGSDFLKSQMTAAFNSVKRAIGGAIEGNEDYKKLLGEITTAVGQFAAKIREGDPDFDAFISKIMQFGSDTVKKAPGYIEAITTKTEALYDTVKPIVSLIEKYPTILDYGIIGAFIRGKKGLVAGIAAGLITDVAKDLDAGFDYMLRKWGLQTHSYSDFVADLERKQQAARQKANAESAYVDDNLFRLGNTKPDDGGVAAFAQALGYSTGHLKKFGKEVKESGNKVDDAGDKVEDFGGSAGEAADDLERQLQSAEEWYAKENEIYEGMYQDQQEHERAVKHLNTLYKQGAIGLNDFNAGITKANNKASGRYMFGQFLGYDYVYNENGDPVPRGWSDRDRSASDEEQDTWGLIAGGLNDLQDTLQYGGIEVRGLSSFAEAARSYGAYLNPQNGKAANPADLYNAIGAVGVGLGEMIGGRVGNVISSTVSMGAAGATLGAALAAGGGPYGAAIGAAIGLVSSLFSNDDEERRARRDDARKEAFSAIQDMALEGGPLSAELMRRSDWSWQNLSVLRHTPDLSEEFGAWWPERLFADNGVEGIADRQEAIAAIDNLFLSIKSFTDSGFSQSLDKLNIKYEYLAQKSWNLALSEEARLKELIQLVTGINADTVVGSVSSALSSAAANGEDAGEIFVESFTREILDGVASTAISQMVTSSIMPILEEPLSQIAQSMTAGEGFDASALAEAVSLAKSAAASVAPVVQELYAAFETSGMWAAAMGDDVDEAAEKWTALIEKVTGVSAQSVTSNIMSAMSSVSSQGGDVGQAFVQNFMDSVMSGLQSYAVDQLVSTVIEPMMAPVMDQIANSISISDGIDEEGLSNALAQAEELARSAAPFIEDLYGVLDSADFYKKRNQTPTADARKLQQEIDAAVREATMEMSAELDAALKKIEELEEQKTRTSTSALQSAAEDAADALRGATEALAEFRAGLFVTAAGSIKSLGTLQAQQSVVDRLVAEAMSGDTDSRVVAMQDLPAAVRASLSTSRGLLTDPLEYTREVAHMSGLLGSLTGERETTMADIQRELRMLREENQKLLEELKKRNETGEDTLSVLRDFQTNGVLVQEEP